MSGSGTLTKIAFVGAAIILIPAIVAGGGFLLAVPLAILWIVGLFGAKEGVEAWKNSNIGRKAGHGSRDINSIINTSKSDGKGKKEWDRE